MSVADVITEPARGGDISTTTAGSTSALFPRAWPQRARAAEKVPATHSYNPEGLSWRGEVGFDNHFVHSLLTLYRGKLGPRKPERFAQGDWLWLEVHRGRAPWGWPGAMPTPHS